MGWDNDEEQTIYVWKKQKVEAETPKAWGIKTGEQTEYAPGKFRDKIEWLPKSQVRAELSEEQEADELFDFYIPEWLVIDKNLENLVEEES